MLCPILFKTFQLFQSLIISDTAVVPEGLHFCFKLTVLVTW